MNTYGNTILNSWKKWRNISLVWRICIGLALGVVLGLIIPKAQWIAIFGKIFVSALKAIAPVLVFVIVAAALSQTHGGLKKQFTVLIFRYILTTIIAATVAIVASYLFPVTLNLSVTEDVEIASTNSVGELFEGILLKIFSNPIAAICEANYLSILFWALLTGFALKRFASLSTKNMVTDFSEVVSQLVKWVIQFAPWGIMGLVYATVSTSGLEVFTSYGHLLLLLVGSMLFCTFITNPIIVSIIIKGNPFPILFKCLKDSGIPALFTRSSAANIPVNMQLCEEMKVDRGFYSVAVPLGSTINMDGAAVTITVMTMATCHTLGIEVGLVQAILLCLLSAAAACGASGVAGGSLLLIPMACALFGITNDVAMQVVAIGFIIGVVQDSVETALNSSNDALYIIAADRQEKMRRCVV